MRHGVRNFRFNESLIHMLSNVEAMSTPVRASGEESFDMVVPAMKVRDFQLHRSDEILAAQLSATSHSACIPTGLIEFYRNLFAFFEPRLCSDTAIALGSHELACRCGTRKASGYISKPQAASNLTQRT